MAVIIGADNGTISGSGGLKLAGDSSGIVQLTSGANITALTLDASQNATFAGKVASAGSLQLATNGTTTALTLDASQNATFAGKVASAGSLQLATNGTTTALTIDTSQKATFAGSVNIPGGSGSINAINTFGFKNRIINGGMNVNQYNVGTIAATDGTFAIDRWRSWQNTGSGSKGNMAVNLNSVGAPTGFTNYLGFQTTSVYSVGSTDAYGFQVRNEGQNMADLLWGTANAKAVTMSFWVYSSLTGTFGGSIKDTASYSYPFSYSIPVANTWTQIVINIPGPTSGSWGTGSSVWGYINFSYGAGSSVSASAGSWAAGAYWSATGATSVVGTNGATFYITGVQLEVGSQATSFDYRPYGTELALCQRYYEVMYEPFGAGRVNGTPACRYFARYSVIKRATPTIGYSGAFSTSDMYTIDTQQSSASGLNTVSGTTTSGTIFGFNVSTLAIQTPFTSSAMCFNLNNGASLTVSAEL